MRPRHGQRLLGRVHAHNREAQAGELLRQESPATTDIQGPQAEWAQVQLFQEHASHVAEPRRIESGKSIQEAALIPPPICHPIVNGIIYGHRLVTILSS
jgi:hypothetical protein